jgi:hypothetical protein
MAAGSLVQCVCGSAGPLCSTSQCRGQHWRACLCCSLINVPALKPQQQFVLSLRSRTSALEGAR